MQQVVAAGTGGNARALGRSDAGKTGTATGLNNTHVITSWFAGFTPQVSTAVIYLRTNPKSGAYLPLDGAMPSYFGADYPTRTWTSVMRGVLEGMPVLSFPPKGNVAATQKDSRHGIYSPPPTSSAPPKKPKPQKSKTPKAPQSSTTDPSPSTPEETNPTPPEPSATCTAILNGATYPCNTQ